MNNFKSMLIPEGLYGFQTLSKNCELLYLHTSAYKAVLKTDSIPLMKNFLIIGQKKLK